ncbi:MAG: hypothetical protein Hals2KO_14670 [Halioglobus sp.]
MKLNHVLVRSSDLDASERFFTEVIGLDAGDRPPFPFRGAWFYSEGQPLAHVVEDRSGPLADRGPLAHVAFQGADYEELIGRLIARQVPYSEKDVPLSRERQVFVEGPDGLTVEMMFPLDGRRAPHPYRNTSK